MNIYNEWTLKAQDNLKELNPNKFPEPQKIGFRGAEGFYVADLDDGSGAAANENVEEAEEDEGSEEEAEVSKCASS